MIETKIKSKRKAVTAKIQVTNPDSKEIIIQNRKTFFEKALTNLNNNPFRIVML